LNPEGGCGVNQTRKDVVIVVVITLGLLVAVPSYFVLSGLFTDFR
jgi:hypothetical protein